MTRSRCAPAAAFVVLALLAAITPAEARLALVPHKPTTRALLNHLQTSSWEWSWDLESGLGTSTWQPAAPTRTTAPSTETQTVSSFSAPARTPAAASAAAAEAEAYQRDLSARLEAAVFDIFGAFFRIFGLAFEPVWRALGLDLGLVRAPPPPTSTPAWVTLLNSFASNTPAAGGAVKLIGRCSRRSSDAYPLSFYW